MHTPLHEVLSEHGVPTSEHTELAVQVPWEQSLSAKHFFGSHVRMQLASSSRRSIGNHSSAYRSIASSPFFVNRPCRRDTRRYETSGARHAYRDGFPGVLHVVSS